jgi:phage gp29-like protein
MSDETPARPVRDVEIASTRDGIDITRGYTGPLLVPADRILRQRGANDLSIYEQVLSEPQVMSTLSQRQNAVVKCEWEVQPGGTRRIDIKAAEHLKLQLQRIGFDERTKKMLFGVFYGFAVAEMMYDYDGGMVVWKAIKVRNRRRFRFTPSGELRLLTMHNMFDGVELPKEKFWSFATGADHDDEPYGLGLGHWCYWPVLFKRNGIKFWLTFLEKFGMPTGVGRYDAQTDGPAEQAKLLAAVQAIQSDSGIIVPKGMELELLSAGRSGTADYQALHNTMDEAIAKAVLGQTMTSQDGSSQSQANVHMDVRQDLVKADADLVCESLNLGPVAWLTRWNFPGAELPRVYRVVEEPEDLTERAKRDAEIVKFGFRPTLAYVHDTYGGEWTEKAPDPPPEPIIDVPPAFAAPQEARTQSDPPMRATTLLDGNLQSTVTGWIDQVRALVDKADSLEAVRDGLLALAPEMTLDQYATLMQEALAAASLAGRYEILQEARGAAGSR